MFKLPTPNAAAFISPPPRGIGPTGMPSAARYCRCRSRSNSCSWARAYSRASISSGLSAHGVGAQTQFSTTTRRAAAAPERRWRGVAAINRRDGAAKCIDCSTVLTFSVKLKVLSVARHRWRSSSNIWSPAARIILKFSLLSRFLCCFLARAKCRQRHSLLLKLNSWPFKSKKAQAEAPLRHRRDTPPDG